MFSHIFRYTILQYVRNKSGMFWMLAFPIILGTLFNIAFSSIYEKDEKFNAIPVALVVNEKNQTFEYTLEQIDKGDEKLFDITKTTEDKALMLLDDGKVDGIIFEADEISLTIKNKGIKPTIIKFFLDQYKINVSVITDAAKNNPAALQDVVDAMSADISSFESENNVGTNNTYVQYFYNLMAMAALYCAIGGLAITVNIQGNLSAIGARRCVSPAGRLITAAANVCAIGFVNMINNSIALLYLVFVLKIDFGIKLGYVFAVTILGSLLGTSLGFFVGSIGKGTENMKMGILMGVTMFCCFCSGLMVGNMKSVIEKHVPFFNRINPATLISQSYCALNLYSTNDKLYTYLITIAAMTVIFTVSGFLMTRRQSYASL